MFSNEIETFEIQLDNPTATYTPGDIIIGKLIIVLNCKKSLRALKLRFNGECKVDWSESRGTGSDSETDYYNGTENYFRTDICLLGSADGDTFEMEPGRYVYPFSYKLPRDIPSSYEHRIGKIRYSIEGIFDRAWRLDNRVSKIITIRAPLEWELIGGHDESGIDDEIVKSFCCCLLPCINVGKMLMKVRIPNTVFECGERIEARIIIMNKSHTVNVTKLKLKLEEKLDFHSKSPVATKSDIKIIRKVKELGPFSKNNEVKLSLQVPELPFSFFQHCKLIDVNYRLNISVHFSGCHCATKKIYNIVIGSRSPVPSMTHHQPPALPMVNYSTPSAPPVPINENSTSIESFPRTLVRPHSPLYSPPVFPGKAVCPYPPENIHKPPLNNGFMHPLPLSNQNNSDEAPPPHYSIATANNQRKT